ncbi:MAG: ABC transporter substrate-binding protein [Pseudomonadota bacterium]
MLLFGVWVTGSAIVHAEDRPSRVVSIGGSVTEIVFLLDQQARLVARDTTSTFPSAAEALPDVGYMRSLSPEGVLSVDPLLIIAEQGAGPQETIDIMRAARIPFITIPDGYNAEAVAEKIQSVGKALGVSDEATALAAEVQDEIHAATQSAADAAALAGRKRVMFVLSTQGGKVMAAGQNTAADAIISMAAADNAVQGIQGYKPLTDEAITAAAPDVILIMETTRDHQVEGTLKDIPAVRTTPAGKQDAIVKMDGLLLLGFGPRTGQAIAELSSALYGDS